ncbi:MAG: hypothetical protein ACU0DH_16820 [Paracoccus sp. (in: a-proteobacteria)]|uniref:hypothetical protein n=1 Tax=Paracoccus sp. TaxID=267 RepID=UPI004059575C
MTRPILLAAMIAVPMLSVPALAQDADTVVATVGDEQITLGQMIVMKQSIQDPNMANLPDQALWDMMLDQLIARPPSPSRPRRTQASAPSWSCSAATRWPAPPSARSPRPTRPRRS